MSQIIIRLFYIFKMDVVINKLISYHERSEVIRLSKKFNTKINYCEQGKGGVTITSTNTLNKFKIDETSHLKSNTFIECSGGVTIGKYFHTGRGLTIFSNNHNYNSEKSIPYDETSIDRPVIIEDFVWFGSNVTVVPGVTVGEGAVVGSGAVLTKDVPPYSVVGGNPAKVIKMRDLETFQKLKDEKKYY